MRRFGGERAVLGRSLTLNGLPYEIVGVLPASFDVPREVMPTLGGAEHAEIVLPLPLSLQKRPRVRSGEDYNILGKLITDEVVAARSRNRCADGAPAPASIRTSIRRTAA